MPSLPSVYRSKICAILATLFLILVFQFPSNAQQPQPTVMPPTAWLDHYRISTISVGVVSTDKTTQRQFFEVGGTALVIGVDSQTGYIVTAKHVFYDPEKNWHPKELKLRFAWQEQKSVFEELGTTLTLQDAAGKDLWKSLDDGSDLAAIELPTDIIKKNPAHGIGLPDFATDADLFMDAPIIVLGYPGVVGNEYLVRAVVRQGIVAWTNPIDPMKQTFMVDANVFPGNSGSPVFKLPTGLTKEGAFAVGGKAAFLGILSKVPAQNDPVTAYGQALTFTPPGQIFSPSHPMTVQVAGLGGIGIIEPASKVLLLVQSFQTKK
jgi:V8-like Glu-specific endopeptidase